MDKINLTKKHIAYCILFVISLFLLPYLLFSNTSYDCSGKEEIIKSSLNACFAEETNRHKADLELEAERERIKLETVKEKNRHCEMVMAQGKMCIGELDSFLLQKISDKESCSTEVKAAFCTPRFFLWKLWHL